MPRSSARWIASMESWSSCAPQANSQSPPPMAHAPKPMRVMSRPELPSFFLGRACVVMQHWMRQRHIVLQHFAEQSLRGRLGVDQELAFAHDLLIIHPDVEPQANHIDMRRRTPRCTRMVSIRIAKGDVNPGKFLILQN